MPYIQMSRGLTIDLLNPNPDDLVLEVLADALGYLARYTGHIGRYSVAEHLVLGARVLRDQGADPMVMRGYLMHDAHEAVIGDVSSPIKAALRVIGQGISAFDVLEARHEEAVQARFRVAAGLPSVKAMDLAMCRAEAEQGFGMLRGDGWPSVRPAPIKLRRWSAAQASAEFLVECSRLDIS